MARSILCAIAGLLMTHAAGAHEQSLHKGHPTEGRVASVSEKSLVVETDKGNVSVTLMDTTKIEGGDTPMPGREIRTGDHVSVFGTKLESGELVAKEIIDHGPEHGGDAAHPGHQHEQ